MIDYFTPAILGCRSASGIASDDTGPPFSLQTHPSHSPPRLRGFLPSGSNVPVPFEPTVRRNHQHSLGLLNLEHYDVIPRPCVHSVCAPGGEGGELGTHVASELARISEDHRTPETVDARLRGFKRTSQGTPQLGRVNLAETCSAGQPTNCIAIERRLSRHRRVRYLGGAAV